MPIISIYQSQIFTRSKVLSWSTWWSHCKNTKLIGLYILSVGVSIALCSYLNGVVDKMKRFPKSLIWKGICNLRRALENFLKVGQPLASTNSLDKMNSSWLHTFSPQERYVLRNLLWSDGQISSPGRERANKIFSVMERHNTGNFQGVKTLL